MRRALAQIRYVGAALGGLRRARRALRPRVPIGDRPRSLLVATALWLRATTRLRVPVPALRLVVGGRPRDVHVGDAGEFIGAYEVLSTGKYDIELRHVRRVLDVGANVGFSSLLFAERYPSAEVVAVEAVPDTFARLDTNVASVPSVRALHLAVGIDGPVRIDVGLPSIPRVLVRSKTLELLLDDLGWDRVDLMKIAIDGAERVLADPAIRRVRAIVGEVHGGGDPRALLPGYDVETRPAPGSAAMMFRAVRAGGRATS